jgi:hypothetical protein
LFEVAGIFMQILGQAGMTDCSALANCHPVPISIGIVSGSAARNAQLPLSDLTIEPFLFNFVYSFNMKKILFFISAISILQFGLAQNQLVSYFNSYSEVHGGMEDSGISRHESYFFKVNATITLLDIYYNEKSLILRKGDTLVINVGRYLPYNSTIPNVISADQKSQAENQKEIPVQARYQVFQKGRCYYANVQSPFIWDGTVNYKCKKKSFTAKAKEGFDSGNTSYAP